jgi:hypothetical protein
MRFVPIKTDDQLDLQLRRSNSSQRRARNLLPKMVCNDRPVYQEEHAAQLIMARRDCSPPKGRIHLRRPVDPPFAFPLQSCGGPYIAGTKADACYPRRMSFCLSTTGSDRMTNYHGKMES